MTEASVTSPAACPMWCKWQAECFTLVLLKMTVHLHVGVRNSVLSAVEFVTLGVEQAGNVSLGGGHMVPLDIGSCNVRCRR